MESIPYDIYNRQKDMNLRIPESVAVLGVGGIGSWVALFFALAGVKRLVMVDPDKIEDTNLNRTPFKLSQISIPKVQAVAELIYERRTDIQIILVKGVEDDFVKDLLKDVEIIVDCRDDEKFFDEEELQKKVVAKLGYDGVGMSVTWNPRKRETWGESIRYTVTPSYLVPPVFLAVLVVDAVVREWIPEGENVTWTFEDGVMEVFENAGKL